MKSTVTKHKIIGKAEPSVIMGRDPSSAAENRIDCIAAAAYYKAEARGFMPGQELDDWLEAEAKFDTRGRH